MVLCVCLTYSMTERTKEIQVSREMRDLLKRQKGILSYNDFFVAIFDYMSNEKKCYVDFLNHLEKKRELPKFPSSKKPIHKKGIKD